MADSSTTVQAEIEIATWLLAALEGHWSRERIRSTMASRYGLTATQARIAEEQARNGILKAIAGSRQHMPDSATDVIGHTTFNLVWNTFNQNSFFDRRRTPSRKWLDWKNQHEPGSCPPVRSNHSGH